MAEKSLNDFHYLFHTLLYNIAWFSCLTLAAYGYAWASFLTTMTCVFIQIVWQYETKHHLKGLGFLIAIVVLISTIADSLLVLNKMIVFAANPFAPYVTAPWMISIWISFTVFLYTTLYKLFNHLIVLGVLAFAGFTAAYGVGAKMGAAFFPYGYSTSFIVGAIWLIFLPGIAYVYNKTMSIK